MLECYFGNLKGKLPERLKEFAAKLGRAERASKSWLEKLEIVNALGFRIHFARPPNPSRAKPHRPILAPGFDH